MRELRDIIFGLVIIGLITWVVPFDAFADAARLEAAIRTTGTSFRNFAIAGLGIGVGASGLSFAVGAGQLGRLILFSVIIGAVITFGGQSIIGMLQSAFR